MVLLGELRVEAILENLGAISQFIDGIGQRLGLTKDALFDIDVAVQEAAANITYHAYPLSQAGDILVRVETVDDVVSITLTDWGLPLDPNNVSPFNARAPIETHIKGGMGLHLIQSLVDSVVRDTAPGPAGPNTITLRKHIERLQSRGLSPGSSQGTEGSSDPAPGVGDQNPSDSSGGGRWQ